MAVMTVNDGAERQLGWVDLAGPMAPAEAITDRPWTGPDTFTRLTVDQLRLLLGTTDQDGELWNPAITRAAVSICRSYGIKGESDFGYVSNVITRALKAQA